MEMTSCLFRKDVPRPRSVSARFWDARNEHSPETISQRGSSLVAHAMLQAINTSHTNMNHARSTLLHSLLGDFHMYDTPHTYTNMSPTPHTYTSYIYTHSSYHTLPHSTFKDLHMHLIPYTNTYQHKHTHHTQQHSTLHTQHPQHPPTLPTPHISHIRGYTRMSHMSHIIHPHTNTQCKPYTSHIHIPYPIYSTPTDLHIHHTPGTDQNRLHTPHTYP